MSGKAHTGHHVPLSTSAGYQKMCSRNKIFKAEIYSDWTNELLISDSKEFKFILFFPYWCKIRVRGLLSVNHGVTLSAFPKNSS